MGMARSFYISDTLDDDVKAIIGNLSQSEFEFRSYHRQTGSNSHQGLMSG